MVRAVFVRVLHGARSTRTVRVLHDARSTVLCTIILVLVDSTYCIQLCSALCSAARAMHCIALSQIQCPQWECCGPLYSQVLTTKKFLRSIPLSSNWFFRKEGVTKVSAISEAIDILGKKELGKSYWTGIPYCMKSAVPVGSPDSAVLVHVQLYSYMYHTVHYVHEYSCTNSWAVRIHESWRMITRARASYVIQIFGRCMTPIRKPKSIIILTRCLP